MKTTTVLGGLIQAVAFMTVGVASGLEAQSTVRMGVALGVSRGTQVWTGGPETSPRYGPAVGVFFEAPTAVNWLAAQAGFRYKTTGARVPLDSDPSVGSGDGEEALIRAHILTLPITAQLRVEVGSATVFGTAGVFYDLVLKSDVDPRLGPALSEAEESKRVLGVTAGVGVDIEVGRIRYGLEATLSPGLSRSYGGSFRDVHSRHAEVAIRVSRPRS